MYGIHIAEDLKKICHGIALGCIQADVAVNDDNNGLWEEIRNRCQWLTNALTVGAISMQDHIKEARAVYRKLGKDPARYRLSSEALIRRVLKEKGLYQVNNVVDINNLISLLSYCPVCTYDLNKIQFPVYFDEGKRDESYQGIGRGSINVENLPVFIDREGIFGSTTSDSERTMVTKETKQILMIIVSFNGTEGLQGYLDKAKQLLTDFAQGENMQSGIII
ncbi:MAG: B3/4 domain-containing protein [Bacillota bacterium]